MSDEGRIMMRPSSLACVTLSQFAAPFTLARRRMVGCAQGGNSLYSAVGLSREVFLSFNPNHSRSA